MDGKNAASGMDAVITQVDFLAVNPTAVHAKIKMDIFTAANPEFQAVKTAAGGKGKHDGVSVPADPDIVAALSLDIFNIKKLAAGPDSTGKNVFVASGIGQQFDFSVLLPDEVASLVIPQIIRPALQKPAPGERRTGKSHQG
jgi:hypothetical protein